MRKDIAKDGVKTQFSKIWQPKTYRKADPISAILKRMGDEPVELVVEGMEVKKDASGKYKDTGKITTVKITNPSNEAIAIKLRREALKNPNSKSMDHVLDRTEGKVMQGVGLSNIDGTQLTMPAITFQIEKPSEVERSKPK